MKITFINPISIDGFKRTEIDIEDYYEHPECKLLIELKANGRIIIVAASNIASIIKIK